MAENGEQRLLSAAMVALPMKLDFDCYQALLSRDTRFDGRFFVCVKTTGIYCRPICRVKTPMRKNCQFLSHAAAAEAAGFRPCKRCRPELAPGNSPMEVSSQLARSTAYQIGQDFLAELIRSHDVGLEGMLSSYLEQNLRLFLNEKPPTGEPVAAASHLANQNYQRWHSAQEEIFRTLIRSTGAATG